MRHRKLFKSHWNNCDEWFQKKSIVQLKKKEILWTHAKYSCDWISGHKIIASTIVPSILQYHHIPVWLLVQVPCAIHHYHVVLEAGIVFSDQVSCIWWGKFYSFVDRKLSILSDSHHNICLLKQLDVRSKATLISLLC